MTRQYLRQYTLVLDDGENQRIIRQLRIGFEIKKSIQSYPNLAKIVIYNPNKDTIAVCQKKYSKVLLSAGYENDEKLLFKGQIRTALINKKGVDQIVTIFSGDGQKDWEGSFFNKTYSSDTKLDVIIDQLVGSFQNTTKGIIPKLGSIGDKMRGQTLSGLTRDILDQFAQNYGFQWSIQDGVFNLRKNNEIDTSTEMLVINSLTGMIGEPTVTHIGADVKILLNANAKPNAAFKVESIGSSVQQGNLYFQEPRKTRAEGIYKIFEVVHNGDTHSDEWSTSIRGQSNYANN
jgi:hypothetical protein